MMVSTFLCRISTLENIAYAISYLKLLLQYMAETQKPTAVRGDLSTDFTMH